MNLEDLKKRMGSPHRVIWHPNDGLVCCDICGKKGATFAIIFGDLHEDEDFNVVGPVWLNNNEIYWVGAGIAPRPPLIVG